MKVFAQLGCVLFSMVVCMTLVGLVSNAIFESETDTKRLLLTIGNVGLGALGGVLAGLKLPDLVFGETPRN